MRGLTPDDQHLAKVVAAGLGLQIQGLSRHGVVTVRKPPDHDYSRSRAALQAACEDIGHRPFLRLLSQPLLEGGELDERDRSRRFFFERLSSLFDRLRLRLFARVTVMNFLLT